MGNNYSQLIHTLSYYDLSRLVFQAKSKDVREQADFIVDNESRSKFLAEELQRIKREHYGRHSRLDMNFDHQDDLFLLESFQNMRLPDLGTIILRDIGLSPPRFEQFLAFNLPSRVDHLKIYKARMSLVKYRLNDLRKMIKDRIVKSIKMSEFQMSVFNLESLLHIFSDLESIDMSGSKIVTSEEILLDDDFENLKSLNLEEIGLSEKNIKIIVDHLIRHKTILHMNYLNLYHKGMEDMLLELDSKLRK